MIKHAKRIYFLLCAVLSPAVLGFAFSDYVEDDLNTHPDPLANWLDQGAQTLCLTAIHQASNTPVQWFTLQRNTNTPVHELPLFRSNWLPPKTAADAEASASADCLYQKTVLRVANEFPEIALSQPYFFNCASDSTRLLGKRLQFALEPIDDVRFKLHLPTDWPLLTATSFTDQTSTGQISTKTTSAQFSTTILQQTDASRCQAR